MLGFAPSAFLRACGDSAGSQGRQGRVSLALNAARKGLGGPLPTQVVALPSGGLRVAVRGPPARWRSCRLTWDFIKWPVLCSKGNWR